MPHSFMRIIASFILSTERVMAKRMYPEPDTPKPVPGVTTIPASLIIFATNSTESGSFHPDIEGGFWYSHLKSK